MFEIFLSSIVRPLTLVVLFVMAAYVAHLLRKIIPAGRIKNVLYRKHEMFPTPDNEAERRNWTVPLAMLLGFLLIFGEIAYLDPTVIGIR